MDTSFVLVTESELAALRHALATALDALEALERNGISERLPVSARHPAPTPEELAELF